MHPARPRRQPSDNLVNRSFDPKEPDQLWVMDVTEHPTSEGKLYVAVVLDAFSRIVIGWSIADHIRSELVVDALQMAIWKRRPPEGALGRRLAVHELGLRTPPALRWATWLHGIRR
jgi:putative transposase